MKQVWSNEAGHLGPFKVIGGVCFQTIDLVQMPCVLDELGT